MLKLVELFRNEREICSKTRKEEEARMFIPPEVKKCVGFIGYETDKGETKFQGTCFLVNILNEKPYKRFNYFITAKHNIEKAHQNSATNNIWIRFNAINSGFQNMITSLEDWIFHQTTDIAVLKNEALNFNGMDLEFIPQEHFIDEKFIRENYVGIGEDVVIVGLFTKHGGRERNLPIVRLGNIAMMPDEPIEIEGLGDIEAYIIESISIGGLSGSPVFTIKDEVPRGDFRERSQLYLLGLIYGHWELPQKTINQMDSNPREPDKINTGLTIVIPASKIIEVINYEELRKEREAIIKKEIEDNSPAKN